MPTPFTHLHYAHRWLNDPQQPPAIQRSLTALQSDFLLGSVAADARVPAIDSRAATHFYTYSDPISEHPWRVMLAQNPSLPPHSGASRAFLAGYVFHLAMDEYWSREMLEPHFARGTWGKNRTERFYVLHLLLISMDERDRAALPAGVADCLRQSQPHDWLPFMSDLILTEWRDFIARQLEGHSETLEIFGGRILKSPAELRAALDSQEQMDDLLYQHLTPPFLADFEQHMYDFASEQLRVFDEDCR